MHQTPSSFDHSITQRDYFATIRRHVADVPSHLVNLYEPSFSYSLVITGTIGSGKSTICSFIEHALTLSNIPVVAYPEFLYTDTSELASLILRNKIVGHISQLTFQSYILDCWHDILKRNVDRTGVHIYERTPDDTVICFAGLAHLRGEMSTPEYHVLYQRMMEIDAQCHNSVSYFTDFDFTELDVTDLSIAEAVRRVLCIIADDMQAMSSGRKVMTRVIGLNVSDAEAKKRIQRRDRAGESGYTDEILRMYNRQYRSMYESFMSRGRLTSFNDMLRINIGVSTDADAVDRCECGREGDHHDEC